MINIWVRNNRIVTGNEKVIQIKLMITFLLGKEVKIEMGKINIRIHVIEGLLIDRAPVV